MYGTARRVNRAMVMQLHGAASYFDCTGALIVTDGTLIPDASEVARKLRVEVRLLPAERVPGLAGSNLSRGMDFDSIWTSHIVPLQGTTLRRSNGDTNEILRVDWGGIKRRTSNGKEQVIGIEIFRSVINRLLAGETVTRSEINDD